MTESISPAPPVAHARLLRSTTDRMAGGVAGGLADYSRLDPVLWRVGFVGLTLAGGAGIVIYLLLWVLVPSAPLAPGQTVSPLEGFMGRLHEMLTGGRAAPHAGG
jgi:phage shock protein C